MVTQFISESHCQASGMSILIGGDNHSDLAQLITQLDSLGYRSTQADSAKRIISQLCEQNFDLILLCISPDMADIDSVFAFIAEHTISGAILIAGEDIQADFVSSGLVPACLNYAQMLSYPFNNQSIKADIRSAITQYAFSHTSGSMQAELKEGLKGDQAQQIVRNQYDSLTNLPNRTLFHDRLNMALAQARRNKSGLALMHLNLDRFKRINDSLGHATGDWLLKMLSQRISDRLRECDTLARIGGDEFLLLLPDVDTQVSGATIAEKLMKAFQSPFMLHKQEVYITARLGVALYPDSATDAKTLMAHADLAMSQLKLKRQTGYAFYCENMSLNSPERFNIERDLRLALIRDECFVEFQPQISMQDASLLGVEALIRWQHPTRGLIRPDEFISVAEESSQIIDVDTWMLNRACDLLKQQFDRGLPQIQLAVNFSPVFVNQTHFVETLLTTLAKYDFPNHCFELEITENIFIDDMGAVVEKLTRLRKAGISIAIDDFGTGYSALGYLKHIPASTLKIDRSFINDITDAEKGDGIVNAIVSMGLSQNLHVIAEGVETQAQKDYLEKINCHAVQGYLTGKAMSLDDIVKKYWQVEPDSLKNTA